MGRDLARHELALHTAASAGTGYSPFLSLCGVHPRPEIDSLSAPAQYGDIEEFIQNRWRIRRDDTENTKHKLARLYFDAKHTLTKDTDCQIEQVLGMNLCH
jgi:hypothetical protein